MVVLTITVAVVAYIFQYKLDEWIITPGKKVLMPAIEKGFKENFTFIAESAEKDSLMKFISSYIEKSDWTGEKHDSAKINFWNHINLIASDSIISFDEIEKLKNIFEIENERPKKN